MNNAVESAPNLLSGYLHFYDQYADDAAFLWLLRDNAVTQPHYFFHDLTELDERIDALLDALMSAPEESWEICERALSTFQQAGESFVATILAFRSLDVRKIQTVVEYGLLNTETFKGLSSALAWLPGRLVHSWVKKFLTSKDLNHKYLAIAVCSARREDPREFLTQILQREDCMNHELLYARALRLVGEIKRFDLLPALRAGAMAESDAARFWAIWSQIMLGDRSQAVQLESWVFSHNPHHSHALELCFSAVSTENARRWISQLSKDSKDQRTAIKAAATFGDPQVINWLLSQMRIPALSRLAGEAFTTITGIDLEEHKLVLEDIPELEEVLPDDGAQNESLELDDDKNLPFPDVDKVSAVWQKYQQRFAHGQRYFMGKMLTADDAGNHFRQIFSDGRQRQRARAALHLALSEPGQFLFNHAAKSNAQ
ncbi:MAG: TIGR02270 family protein [Cellvibrio sp.]|jgi:uncharacterized protein (TIGR02270 family)